VIMSEPFRMKRADVIDPATTATKTTKTSGGR